MNLIDRDSAIDIKPVHFGRLMKKSLCFFILLATFILHGFNAGAQYFKPVWVNDIGGSGDSKATNIAVDNSGDIYISGYIRGTETFNLKEGGSVQLASRGDADVYVAKYNIATGNYIWAFSFGGDGTDLTNSMTLDHLGNVIITGQFQSTVNFNPKGNFTLSSHGSDDIFIAKYTQDGNFIWATSMGGGDIDRGHYITVDSQNNIILTASYTGSININPSGATFNLPNQNSLALFFAKYDPNGNLLWAHPLGNVNQANLSGIAVDKTTDDVIVDGDFSGTVDFSYSGNASATFNSPSISNFLARYANDGTFKWVDYMPGSGSGIVSSVHIDSQSNIVLTGSFGGKIYPGGPSGAAVSATGTTDLLVASYTSGGTLKWANHYGSSTSSLFTRYITTDANNNIFVTGFFTGTINIDPNLSDGILKAANGGNALYIAGFDSSGKAIAAGAIGGTCSANTGYEMAAVNGKIYVAGSFCQTADFDTGSCDKDIFFAVNGTSDSFVASFVIANETPPSITVFSVPQQVSAAVINQTNHTIAITVGTGTNVTALTPTVTLSNATTVNPASGTPQNFSSPVTYTVSSGCGSVPYTVTVTVGSAKATAACSGTTVTLAGDVVNPAPDSYTWQVFQNNAWVNAPGVINNKDYQAAFTNNTASGIIYQVRRQISVGGNVSDDSFYDVTVSAALANNVITAPSVTSFCSAGDASAITGSAPTGGDGTYVYQWQSSADNINFTDISGATAKDYDPAAISTNTYYRRGVTSGACNVPVESNVIEITILPAVANNAITAPAVTAFCASGDPQSIIGSTPTGGNGVYVYQWQSSVDNVNFTSIAGATAKDYDPTSISANTWYRRIVVSGACVTPLISNIVEIMVILPVANNITTAPAITSFCTNGDPTVITGSTPTGGNSTYAYQWQISTDNINFMDIPGATAKDYTPTALSTTTWFRRTVTSGVCTTPQVSNKIEIVILPAVANNTITAPAVTAFCGSGDPRFITGSTPTGGTGAYIYQWQNSTDGINFTDINGATSKSYDPPSLSANTWYRRLVTSGVCTTPLISNDVEITIIPVVANNTIAAPQITTFCSTGDPAAITGSTPTGGDGTYTYQWQSSTDNVTFSDITGATSINYDPPSLTANTWYRRIVTSGVCTTPLVSNVIEIIIIPPVANNTITAPAITAFCGSGDPSQITGSTPTGGNGSYTYQWQSSIDNVNFTDINGATLKNYDPASISVTTYYRRNVISGICNTPLVSNVANIQINAIPATPVPAAASVGVCPGNTASLSVASPVQGLTYDWYDSAAKTNHLFTGATYVTGPINSAQTFYVEATGGTCVSPSLAAVQVTLNSIPAAPAANNLATCDGTSVTLSIVNPVAGYTYNWYAVATGGNLLVTGPVFTTPAITANISYYAEAVNSTGCVSLTRTEVKVTDNPLPLITAQNNAVCPGLQATLGASSTDNNAVINWYAAATGGSILFTGTSFTTPAISTSTTYYAEAVDNVTGCSSAARAAVVAGILQPLAAPVVTIGPTTTSTITFEWTAVPGATGYQISIDNGQTFTTPSTGSTGLSHTLTGLQYKQTVTIVVRAVGAQPCELSTSSTAVTAQAINPAAGDLIYVPNAFTPNGDGKNDQVHIHSESIKSLNFYVYDQWGELIYSTNEQQNGWDGTFKGKKEPAGVYVYYLEAVMNDGEKLTKKGTITLLR